MNHGATSLAAAAHHVNEGEHLGPLLYWDETACVPAVSRLKARLGLGPRPISHREVSYLALCLSTSDSCLWPLSDNVCNSYCLGCVGIQMLFAQLESLIEE